MILCKSCHARQPYAEVKPCYYCGGACAKETLEEKQERFRSIVDAVKAEDSRKWVKKTFSGGETVRTPVQRYLDEHDEMAQDPDVKRIADAMKKWTLPRCCVCGTKLSLNSVGNTAGSP